MSEKSNTAMAPDDLARAAGVGPEIVSDLVRVGRLGLTKAGLVRKADCVAYLRQVALDAAEAAEGRPLVVEPEIAAPGAAYDPEDPNWTDGCDRARLDYVSDLLAQCVAPRRVVRQCMDQWNCSRKVAERYLKLAHEDLSALGAIGAEHRRDQYREALCEVLQECMADVGEDGGPRDLKTAARILDQLVKLDGGYPAQKISLSGEITGAADPQKIRERISAYLTDPDLLARAREKLTDA